MKRVLTALVLAPAVVALTIWAPPSLFAALVAALAVLAVLEFYALAAQLQAKPYRWLGAIATAAVVLHLELAPAKVIVPLVAALLAFLLRALFRPDRSSSSFADAGSTTLGFLYLGLLLGLTGALRTLWGARWLLFLLAAVWAGDVAALYVGKLLGRHKMAPRVSPGKTWEGAAGSFVVAGLVGLGFGFWFQHQPLRFLFLGLAINVAAQFGDLAESLLKRAAGAKDSGALLPGHGGVLDRIDAMLFAAPVLWFYLLHAAPFH
ncbi:MAG: phosphatidate cytidylyltransferase [Terriglobales bacterium]